MPRWLLSSCLLLLSFCLSAAAQDAPPSGNPSEKTDGRPDGSPNVDGKADAPVIREQTIYVPYTKLRETFEKDGRGVFLPYEKFQELWKAARGKEAAAAPAQHPTGAIITEIESAAVAEKDVVRVSARLAIELLSKGWHHVPIRLGDAAIVSAKIGGEPARLVPGPQGFQLLIQHAEEKPKIVTLELEYAKAFVKNPGRNSLSFQAPQAPVNRWRIEVPQAGAKIQVQPMIAASEPPDAKKPDDKKPDDKKDAADPQQTVLLAFVGAAPQVQIDWTAKAEGASGLEALVNVQVQQEMTIEEGVVRTRATLVYDITRSELSQLTIELPADQKVVNVFDPNVRQWEVKPAAADPKAAPKADPKAADPQNAPRQQIQVALFQPTKGVQQIVVEMEKFLEDMNQKELRMPVVQCLGVGRQQGVVVVRVASSLRAEVQRRTGLTQLDASELPAALARTKWYFAYRYATLPLELSLTTEKLQPKIRVDELVEAYLEPEQWTLDLLAKYQIERAGVFQLELDVPAGFEIRQVRGHAVPGGQPAAVDSHHLQGDAKTRLVVNLSQKALGTVGLFVELQKRLEDPNLLTPTDKNSELPLPLPRALTTGVEHAGGRLVLYSPESLRVNPDKQTGVRVISVAEALQEMPSTRGGRFGATRELLAFAFTAQPVDLSLAAGRRKPFVGVRQLLVARIDAGAVKYEATFYYDIRYSGVKTLRIDVPQAIAAQIRNETPAIRERTIEPAPDDLANAADPNAPAAEKEKYVAWSFSGETELFGQPSIRLTWERKLDELEVGKPLEIVAPQLRPRNVDRANGQIVITKAESIDVQPLPESTGLRGIDQQLDLMPEAQVPDAARAFQFEGDWSLKIAATRYKLEEVKRTNIERAVVRTVVTRSNEQVVQAVYRIRSAHQRLRIQLPTGFKLDTQPLSIDGKRIALERGNNDELSAPLVGQSTERPFLLELRYTLPGNHRRIELPEFLDDPAIQQVHLCVYLPRERVLLGSNGPWTEEFSWRRRDLFSPQPQPHRNDQQLLQEVMQGTACSENPGQTFPTDGTLYIYSTLRPEPTTRGSLRLVAVHERWFQTTLFLVVAAIGLGFFGRSFILRVLLLATALALLVLSGVFLPTFTRQIFNGALFAALFLVAVGWFVELLVLAKQNWRRLLPAAPPPEPMFEEAKSEESQGGEHHG